MADEAVPTTVLPTTESVAETPAVPVATEAAKTTTEPEAAAAPVETAPAEAPTTETAAEDAPTQGDDSIMDAVVPENSEVNGGSTAVTPSKSKAKKKSTATPSSGKKLQRKKSMPDLHINVQPGEHWYVRMKGYAAWPAIICDEEMLPVSLLERRPVSAQRPNGTWREDFDEGGKNLRDRRYPVMFLGTNEFAWQVNTDLLPLDVEEIKEQVEKGEQGKKSKALWQAYQIAAEYHNLEYFKNMLQEHDQRVREEEIRIAEEEAKRLEKKEEKKEKKKATAAAAKTDADGDVVMEDGADEPSEKKKPTKKRKKEEEEDAPKKTKIVLKGLKTADEDSDAKAAKKARKSQTAAETSPEESAVDEEELKRRKEKTVLYMRHKLQKGLVSHGNPPKPEDMGTMAEHLTALENHQDLEADIIQRTKVNKLLKVILKLTTIPRDEEFNFKERCEKLLKAWTVTLQKAEETNAASSASVEQNGNGTVEPKSTEPAVVPSIEGKQEEKELVKEETKTSNGSTKTAEPENEKPVAVAEPEKMVVDPVQ